MLFKNNVEDKNMSDKFILKTDKYFYLSLYKIIIQLS